MVGRGACEGLREVKKGGGWGGVVVVDLGIQGRPGRAMCHLEPHKQDMAGPGWGRFHCCSRMNQGQGLEGCPKLLLLTGATEAKL